MKWKVFDPKSWNALLSLLAWLKGAADANASAASGLGGDLAALSELTAREIAGKQDKPSAVPVTIPATGWESDSMAKYPKYYDIEVPGVTVTDQASVNLSPASQDTAAACGLCPVCETLDGKIRLRSANVPAETMTANYWIEKGV